MQIKYVVHCTIIGHDTHFYYCELIEYDSPVKGFVKLKGVLYQIYNDKYIEYEFVVIPREHITIEAFKKIRLMQETPKED